MKKNLLTLNTVLAKEIKYMLEEQEFHPGDKLPSERELAEVYGVQRLTIRGALSQLTQEGVLEARPRSGYYMAASRILQSTRKFSMNYISPETGKPLESRLYAFQKVKADLHLSGKMLLPEDTPIYRIVKIYSDQGTPICISSSYIPEYIYPDLTLSLADSASPLDLLTASLQTEIVKSNQKITLIYANELESQLLAVEPGSSLMKYKGLMYDTFGQLAIFFENIMLMERFAFIREAKL